MIVYVDTSAALKLLVQEKESAALATQLEQRREGGDTLVASLLLHTELHCAAKRRPEYLEHETVAEVLSAIALVDVEAGDLTRPRHCCRVACAQPTPSILPRHCA